jgi:hypothetical protein
MKLSNALPLAFIGLSLASGCEGFLFFTGTIEDTTGTKESPFGPGGISAPSRFLCNASGPRAQERLRKLTATQYQNTVRDLVTFALNDAAQAQAVLTSTGVAQALERVPRDEREKLPQDLHGSFRRLDQDLQQTHVDATYDAATALGTALAQPSRLGALMGACATDGNAGNDDACLTGFVQKFGERALRHPLTPEDVTFYRGFYAPSTGIDPVGVADVIAALLVSPGFLYQLEHGEAAAGRADVAVLSPFELAARLSYHFWNTMPDRDLFEAARSGALKTPAGFEAQVDRLFADPRTRTTISQFFYDAMDLAELQPLDRANADPVFRAFAGPDLPTASLHTAMTDEVLALMEYLTWGKNGSIEELLLSDLSFARTPELARIYGVAPWTPGGAPPSFPAGARPGLLTRAAFLATGSANTRPVMKGVFIRTNILCDDIPPPPNNAAAVPPALDQQMTTRQVVEKLTETQGTACAACHITLINPLGYATEGFDSLGRVRNEQRLFDAGGREMARMPVDTNSVPRIDGSDTTPATGPVDLMQMILKSGKAQACMARNYFRFTYARWEDLGMDGCTLERLRKALAFGAGGLHSMFKEVAMDPAFKERSYR